MPSFEDELTAGLTDLLGTAGRSFSCDGVTFLGTLSLPSEDHSDFDVKGSHHSCRIVAQRSAFISGIPNRGRTIVDSGSGLAYRIDETPDVDPGDPAITFLVQQLRRTS